MALPINRIGISIKRPAKGKGRFSGEVCCASICAYELAYARTLTMLKSLRSETRPLSHQHHYMPARRRAHLAPAKKTDCQMSSVSALAYNEIKRCTY
eukprot:1451410-Amphidinium_carterae.1